MLQQLRKFHASFHDSEVILWARLQFVLGAAYVALQGVDMSQIISDKQMLMAYIFANGFFTEYLRRRREDFSAKPPEAK